MEEQNVPKMVRETDVVTCLLVRHDVVEPRLLLVQRSQKVGSYRTRWAGISGFIESGVTPEEQAYTEILEETGLDRTQVRLLRRGQVVEHIDEGLGRHFSIHPFLFEVLAPEQIRIDWEAMAMRWVDPAELGKYPTVPKLQEVYQAAITGEVV